MKKLIAMDMDGTLLTENHKILPRTKAILLKLQRQGITLVLASGRSYTRLMEYARELQMDVFGGYLIEINGAAIYSLKEQKRERLAQLSIKQIHELFHYFQKWDVEVLAQFDDGMYDYMSDSIYKEKEYYRKVHNIPEHFPWTPGPFALLADTRNGYARNIFVKDPLEIQESVNKVSVTYHEDKMIEVSKAAKRDLSGDYWIGLTTPRWLEIMPKGVTKAFGLEIVGKRLKISLDEMIAFGDGENDIEMLKAVGLGIAMGNAMDIVKDIADEVCDDHTKDGIAKALEKHFNL